MNDGPTLHFVCGKLASGKTMMAKQIAEVFSEDVCLSRLPSEIVDFRDSYRGCSNQDRHVA